MNTIMHTTTATITRARLKSPIEIEDREIEKVGFRFFFPYIIFFWGNVAFGRSEFFYSFFFFFEFGEREMGKAPVRWFVGEGE